MGYAYAVLSLCTTLLGISTASSTWSRQSMTYNWERTSLTDEFSISGTTYFSLQRQSYRFDILGGMNKLFLYPAQGKAYFYYPTSNFVNNEFNLTKCYIFATAKLDHLPVPLPSLEGYNRSQDGKPKDGEIEKYVRYGSDYYGCKEKYEMWVKTSNVKSGINENPVKLEMKEWYVSGHGWKKVLNKHFLTNYYGFVGGEQQSSDWEHPDVDCKEVDYSHSSLVIELATNFYQSVGVPDELILIEEYKLRSVKKHKNKGRIDLKMHDKEDPLGLLLPFPYQAEECEAIAKELPKSFDWRDFGAVTHVRNQRYCGSCWAHGAVGSLEGAYFRKYKELVVLSEQAIVDCAGSTIFNTGNSTRNTVDGCYGGLERSGFGWIHKAGGIPPAEEYSPYQEINGYCRVTDQTKLVGELEGYYHVPNNTDAVKVALVHLGPLTVSIDDSPFADYTNGIISGDSCKCQALSHSVVLVGYGESAEHGPYWILKDSQGVNYGLEGYTLVSAVGNCVCILDEVYFPKLK